MEEFCRQFGICAAVPAEWHWVMPIVMPLTFIILVGVPVANVLHRAGRSRWWTSSGYATEPEKRSELHGLLQQVGANSSVAATL